MLLISGSYQPRIIVLSTRVGGQQFEHPQDWHLVLYFVLVKYGLSENVKYPGLETLFRLSTSSPIEKYFQTLDCMKTYPPFQQLPRRKFKPFHEKQELFLS